MPASHDADVSCAHTQLVLFSTQIFNRYVRYCGFLSR